VFLFSPDVPTLGKNVPAATSTSETVEEILNSAFTMRLVSYQTLNMKGKENSLLVPFRNSCAPEKVASLLT
jgi:hypothetical protein